MNRICDQTRRLFPVALTAFIMACVILASVILTGCFSEPEFRQEKIQAIARWQDQRLAPQDSLLSMLDDKDAHVRLASVRAAGLIGRDDVLPQMLNALQDQSVTVRAEAAWSLGLLGSPAAVPALETAAVDPRPPVRLAALAGLAHVPNDGQALMEAGIHGNAEEAAVAWDGLRNTVDSIDRKNLLTAIQAGLTRPEGEIRWRVLRCIELVADSTLTGLVTPFARSDQTQVRVYAYRSLARLDNSAALAAVLEGFQSHDRFRGRDAARVRIAGCRALGRLGRHELENEPAADPGPIAALLITAAGSSDPHVSATALTAMAQLVTEAPLPPEAATQESLLPVWRIRLARSARSHLDRTHPGVRAAAFAAYAEVRGSGSADDLVAALKGEESPQVLAAGMRAVSRHHPDPAKLLVHYAEIDFPTDFGESERPVFHNAIVREAAYEGLAHLLLERPELVPDSSAGARLESHLYAGLDDEDFVIAASTARLVGDFPCCGSLGALLRLWNRADGPNRFELRRGVLAGVEKMLNKKDGPWQGPDSLKSGTEVLLRQSFDSPDIRVRLEGRATALATGLLPENLIPTEASLKATLPAMARDRRQPPVAVPFDAPRVRCVTPRGEFVIQLKGKIAPNTCAVFLDLIGQGYFADLTFHRVVPDFVVQGGDPRGDGWGGPGYTIRSEWSRSRYKRAAVGIAHDGKDTGGSQFFVTLSEQPHLGGRYTIFGEVTEGMEVVDRIELGDRFSLEIMP
jgi:cyclophilin family peptidyl-prolyl cis-trans isomerase/HEAT repeat protein